ncbi:hypothetical protein N7488_005146 [Penicillium malachiteum]|nr:hypothetical protein N7488_005146 [Penicillium malachiteum]
MMNWETYHRSYIEQLETRALRLAKGDLRRLSDLEAPQVVERLKVQESYWNNAKNEWASTVSESGRDKSTFTFLLPKDSSSLFVCSIVPVREGDFLGIFAGKIRFSEDLSVTHGIPGPVKNLWLDYSQLTGTMNQMLVAEPDGSANVCLQWEVVDDDIGTESCISWKLFVKAIAPIKPFKPLVRVAAHQEQYGLHSSPAKAKRGFLELCEAN